MKNKKQALTIFLLLTASIMMLGSCRKEKMKPEQADTFIKYYGKGGTQKAGNVALTADGGYILVGTTDSYGNGKDILVVKTDAFGNEQWSKVLGGAGDDEGNWVIVAKDGSGYVLTGSVAETGSITKNIYVAKMNSSGSVIWDKNFGVEDKNDFGARIINTVDGGYAAVGTNMDSLVYLLKFNSLGDTLWTANYGRVAHNIGSGIQELSDSNYVTSASFYLDNNKNILITTGQIQSTSKSKYDPYSAIDNETINTDIVDAKDILLDINRNTIVLGNTKGDNIYIANITTRKYYPINVGAQTIVSDFSKTVDGGFVISGSIFINGNWDILTIHTDASTNIIWSKTFGGTGNDYGASVEQKTDGSFIVAGTMSFGGNGTGANDVMSLIHIDSNGELK